MKDTRLSSPPVPSLSFRNTFNGNYNNNITMDLSMAIPFRACITASRSLQNRSEDHDRLLTYLDRRIFSRTAAFVH